MAVTFEDTAWGARYFISNPELQVLLDTSPDTKAVADKFHRQCGMPVTVMTVSRKYYEEVLKDKL